MDGAQASLLLLLLLLLLLPRKSIGTDRVSYLPDEHTRTSTAGIHEYATENRQYFVLWFEI